MKKIVITNYNVISACGTNKEEFKNNILTNKNFSNDISSFEANNFKTGKAFEINIDFQSVLGKGGLKHINRNSKIAMCCLESLSNDFKDSDEDKKPAMIMGTAFGSANSISEFWKVALIEGFSGLRPLDFPNTTINSSGSFLNIRYNLVNSSVTICNGYNSSLDAFIYASDYINQGYSKWALVGGSEEFGEYTYMGQLKSKVLSEESDYDILSGKGYLPGEGSAFFMVEDETHAKERNAKVIAELIGYSSKFGKDENTRISCYKEALEMANIDSDKIDLVSSGINGIKNENYISLYENLFGNKSKGLIIPYKQFFGECYGASGALQIAAALTNCEMGKISPLLNNKNKSVIFNKDTVDKTVNYFAVDNFSADGNNTVLIFRR